MILLRYNTIGRSQLLKSYETDYWQISENSRTMLVKCFIFWRIAKNAVRWIVISVVLKLRNQKNQKILDCKPCLYPIFNQKEFIDQYKTYHFDSRMTVK